MSDRNLVTIPNEVKDVIMKNILMFVSDDTIKPNSFFYFRVTFNKPNIGKIVSTYYFVKQCQLGIEYVAFIAKCDIDFKRTRENNLPYQKNLGDILTVSGKEESEVVTCINTIERNLNTVARYFVRSCECTKLDKAYIMELSPIRPYSFSLLMDKKERPMSINTFRQYCLEHNITPIIKQDNMLQQIKIDNASPDHIAEFIIALLTASDPVDMFNLDIIFKNPKYDPEYNSEHELLRTGFIFNAIYYKDNIKEDNPNGLRMVLIKFRNNLDSKSGDIVMCDINRHNLKDIIERAISNLYEVIKETYNTESLQVRCELYCKCKDEEYNENKNEEEN